MTTKIWGRKYFAKKLPNNWLLSIMRELTIGCTRAIIHWGDECIDYNEFFYHLTSFLLITQCQLFLFIFKRAEQHNLASHPFICLRHNLASKFWNLMLSPVLEKTTWRQMGWHCQPQTLVKRGDGVQVIIGMEWPGVLNAVRRSICLSILCLSSNCQKRGGDNRNWREALGGFTLEEGHEYYTLLKTRVNWIICLSKVFMLYNLTIKNYLMGLPPTH